MIMKDFRPAHFNWRIDGDIAIISLARPERKNPLTFESYAELRDTFRELVECRRRQVRRVRLERRQFQFGRRRPRHHRRRCSKRDMKGLLAFTRMTGDLDQGDARLPAADHRRDRRRLRRRRRDDRARVATSGSARPAAKTAFLFTRVGLAGCDMGACAMLPRVIGQGRAAELLFTGRTMTAEEGERWGFFNRVIAGGSTRSGGHRARAAARARPDLRPHDDQDHAEPGMVDVARTGDRNRGAGAGDLHADARLQARL